MAQTLSLITQQWRQAFYPAMLYCITFFFFLSTWGNSGSSVIPLLSIITDVSDTAFQEYTRNTDCH